MGGREKIPRRSGLGKGIDSLLGGVANPKEEESTTSQESVVRGTFEVDINLIDPNPKQPRKSFDEETIKGLSASISTDGILQPLIVQHESGRYRLISGERRWRAARLAGLRQIPVIVREDSSADVLRMAIVENIQREDLNVIEEAEAYQELIRTSQMTQEDCARQVGKDRATIANALRLLRLPQLVQTDLIEGTLTPGHARCLLALEEEEKIRQARDIIIKKQLNVRQSEKLCKSFKEDKQPTALFDQDQVNPDLEYLAENLRSYFRTKVKFAGNAARGKIEISYFSPDELERILALVGIQS